MPRGSNPAFPKLVPMAQKKHSKTKKSDLAMIAFFALLPLGIYVNCAKIDNAPRTEKAELPTNVHQKIFVDPAGEKLNPPMTKRPSSDSKTVKPAKN